MRRITDLDRLWPTPEPLIIKLLGFKLWIPADLDFFCDLLKRGL